MGEKREPKADRTREAMDEEDLVDGNEVRGEVRGEGGESRLGMLQ